MTNSLPHLPQATTLPKQQILSEINQTPIDNLTFTIDSR